MTLILLKKKIMKKFNFKNLIIVVSLLFSFSFLSTNFANAATAQKSCAKRDVIVAKLSTFQTNIANQDKEKNNIIAQLQKLDGKLTGAKKAKVDDLLSEIATQTIVIANLRNPVLADYANLENNLCTGNAKTVKAGKAVLKNDIAKLNKAVAAFKIFVKGDLKKAIKKL